MDVLGEFARLPLGDLWDDALLADAVAYARASKMLRIPSQKWRDVLPTAL